MRIQTTVPYLTEATIESRALRLFIAYEKTYGVIEKPPVPIEHIIEAHLELRIVWDKIPENFGINVLAYIDPETRTICLNEGQKSHFDQFFGTEKFTLAHETGHWELHVMHGGWQQLELVEGNGRFLCRASRSDRLEIQANIFAASLLMPSHLVKAEFAKYRIGSLSDIREFGLCFGVSQTAMKRRLQSLRLIRIGRDSSIRDASQGEFGQLRFDS